MSDSSFTHATVLPEGLEFALANLRGKDDAEIHFVILCLPFGYRSFLHALGFIEDGEGDDFRVHLGPIKLLINMVVRARGLYDALEAYADPRIFNPNLISRMAMDPTGIAKDALQGKYLPTEQELDRQAAQIREKLSATPLGEGGLGGFEVQAEPLM